MLDASSPTAAAVIDFILNDSAEDRLRELFDLFDVDGNGRIQREELTKVLALCAHEIGLEVDDYLEQIADAVFTNAHVTQTGDITLDGLREVLKLRPNLVEELALVIHPREQTNFRPEPSMRCKLHEHAAFNKYDSFLERLTSDLPFANKLRWEYISNNYVKICFLLSILTILACLYISRIFTYWGSCGFVIVARASGQCLNFLCSVVVLFVCRRSISYLRSRGFGRFLPVDDHVYFHKLIGWLILGHSIFHTFGHFMNFVVETQKPDNTHTWLEFAFSTRLGIGSGFIKGSASVTGWLLLVILFLMAFAQPYARSLGRFELFYYTHLLFIPFWFLLLIHAPNFWAWFLVPFVVFAFETVARTCNLIRFLSSDDESTIVKAQPLPSDVLYLVIKRPPNFYYNPGDWIYILIPHIAKYEWHPFTISSAPEQENYLTLHIRAVGEWTRSLRSYFVDISHRNRLARFIKSGQFSMSICYTTADVNGSGAGSSQVPVSRARQQRLAASASSSLGAIAEDLDETEFQEADNSEGNSSVGASSFVGRQERELANMSSATGVSASSSQAAAAGPPKLKILIDGPYGSPSGQIFRTEHAVLIATGIGVTPFASILRSIVYHNEKRRHKCPGCAREFLDSRAPLGYKLRKVDFVWINRDQKSFEWFIKLLAELELTQSQLAPEDRFLDIHIYLTAIEKAKIKSIGMQLALYLVHEKNKKDLVTGLRTRTKAGRPDWDEFFENIYAQERGKVSVFFCGRPQLGRQLHRHCDKFGFKFRKEIF